MEENKIDFSFDKDGATYQAAKFRENFTIREFAGLLGNCDETKSHLDINAFCLYHEKYVAPWIKVLLDCVEGKTVQDYDEFEEITKPCCQYTFAGFKSEQLSNGYLDDYGKENLKFPVEAFRVFCNRKGISYPFDTVSKPLTLPKADQDLEVVEGVTVTDIQKMCKRSAALHSVLKTVTTWQRIENPARMTEEALRANLRIAARKDKWGSSNGELAETTQENPIVNLILGNMRKGGRPKK